MRLEPARAPERRGEHMQANMLPRAPARVQRRNDHARGLELGERAQVRGRDARFEQADRWSTPKKATDAKTNVSVEARWR